MAQAPDFTARHVEGRDVALRDYAGRTTVVVLTNKDSSDQARLIARALRSRFTHDDLPIISVADISGAPRMMQGMIRTLVKKGYRSAAEEYTADLQAAGQPIPPDMSQALVMVTDGDGSICAGFGHPTLGADAIAILVGGDGTVLGQASGATAGEALLAQLG